jgi:hypothetical protein
MRKKEEILESVNDYRGTCGGMIGILIEVMTDIRDELVNLNNLTKR